VACGGSLVLITTYTHAVEQFMKTALTLGLVAIAMSSMPAKSGEISFTPDQTGTISSPAVGIGATSTNYILSSETVGNSLDKAFTGNNQETPIFTNPSTMKDGAGFDDTYTLQLGTDNTLRRIRISDGAQFSFNGHSGVNLGSWVFGIGYDAGLNQAGFGSFDGTTMTFKTYDFATDSIATLSSLAFNDDLYGTPTGLDFKFVKGKQHMFVSTKNAPGVNIFAPKKNFILDINAVDGTIDQYAQWNGDVSKLGDLVYEGGRMATVYDVGTSGSVRVGDFEVIPISPTAFISSALEIGFTSLSSETYQVQYATNLLSTNWFDLGNAIIGDGLTNSVLDPITNSAARFYRVILD
jgi:hypothetical protein